MKIPNFSKEEAEAPVNYEKYGIYDMSTEPPEEHVHAFPKPEPVSLENKLKAASIILLILIGIVSITYNRYHPAHNWVAFQLYAGLFTFCWSIIAGVYCLKKDRFIGFVSSVVLFAGSFFYEVLLIIDLIKKI